MIIDPIEISKELIKINSVTPSGEEAVDFVVYYLEKLGFDCYKLKFGDVCNLYAKRGKGKKNFCFAGHLDVVEEGIGWTNPAFSPVVIDDYLYGRGSVDMKPAIAAFIWAASKIPSDWPVSILLSGNEEGDPSCGMIELIKWIKSNNIIITDCIVGEPTNEKEIGDMVKIGRRGSVNFRLKVFGKQGHVAYNKLAYNPIDDLAKIMVDLKLSVIDEGNEYFPASNLEITNIIINNSSNNVIPGEAEVHFNIRFNNSQNIDSLKIFVEKIVEKNTKNYKLDYHSSADPFLNKESDLTNLLKNAIIKITSANPVFSTTGGTSDARFLKDICNVVEFGLISETAHKVDEKVRLKDILKLGDVYLEFLNNYFI